MWFHKSHDLERSRLKVKTNGTIGDFDFKNIDRDNKIVILSALVQKLWSKTSFCIMLANKTHSCTSHGQTAQDIFTLFKGPNPSYLVLKFGGNYLSSNWDMTQNVNLYDHDLVTQGYSWRSIIFSKTSCTLPMSIRVKFHWDPIASFSGKLAHNFPKGGQKKKKEEQ